MEPLTLSPRSPFSPCKGKKKQIRAGLGSLPACSNGKAEHAGQSPSSVVSGHMHAMCLCTLPSVSNSSCMCM